MAVAACDTVLKRGPGNTRFQAWSRSVSIATLPIASALVAEFQVALGVLLITAGVAVGMVIGLRTRRRPRPGRAGTDRGRELERELAQRDRLVENTVHELRTPLTTVVASIEMLRDGYANTEEERGTLYDQAAASCNHLMFLINDLLDAAALRAGQLRIDSAPCYLADAIDDTLRALGPVAAARNSTLDSLCCDRDLLVLADPHRLLQVLFNLTGNALKYSPDGSSVTIQADRSAEGVTIEVMDRGIGVAAAAAPALFARFSRVHSAQASSAPGTGLGLQLCRELVEQMGGRIGYRPREDGPGSVFWFSLPAAAPRQRGAEAEQAATARSSS